MITANQLKILLEESRRILSRGEDIENVLRFLRQSNCTIIDCMRVLDELGDLTPEEVKRTVHYSKTWEDMRERSEKAHELVIRGLESRKQNSTPDDAQ